MYIEAEEKGLRETLESLIKEESWKPMEDAAQTNVLRSASELFAVIKKSLQRCSKFVSRGEPMLHLMGAFQVQLKCSLQALCWGDLDHGRHALVLFTVIKKSLQRCSDFVSLGEPMLHLMAAFQVQPIFTCQKSCANLVLTRMACSGLSGLLGLQISALITH